MRNDPKAKRAFFKMLSEAKSPSDVYQGMETLAAPNKLESLSPRYDYSLGPAYYIGQRICFMMGKLGQPSKIFECYRPPERQAQMVKQGTSHAAPWSSAHQYSEAVDIIHKTRGWPPEDDQYWNDLEAVAKNLEADLGVPLIIAKRDWGWDFAHIAIKSWPEVKARLTERALSSGSPMRPPTTDDLYSRFKEVLPNIKHPDDAKVKDEPWLRVREILDDIFEGKDLAELLKDFF